jgi:hypothetical protein
MEDRHNKHSFENMRGWQLVYEASVDTVYIGISLEMFLVIYNEVW